MRYAHGVCDSGGFPASCLLTKEWNDNFHRTCLEIGHLGEGGGMKMDVWIEFLVQKYRTLIFLHVVYWLPKIVGCHLELGLYSSVGRGGEDRPGFDLDQRSDHCQWSYLCKTKDQLERQDLDQDQDLRSRSHHVRRHTPGLEIFGVCPLPHTHCAHILKKQDSLWPIAMCSPLLHA